MSPLKNKSWIKIVAWLIVQFSQISLLRIAISLLSGFYIQPPLSGGKLKVNTENVC
jgi:hypothetical protein